MNTNQVSPNAARLASLDELIENFLPAHIAPVPSRSTLRSWLDAAKIPRFKPNPVAKRGGGQCFYSVPHVERYFKTRLLSGPLILS